MKITPLHTKIDVNFTGRAYKLTFKDHIIISNTRSGAVRRLKRRLDKASLVA